jgi:hypothetical protein
MKENEKVVARMVEIRTGLDQKSKRVEIRRRR